MHQDDHDLGLSADLQTLYSRRLALGLFAGAGLAAVAGCGSTTAATTATTTPMATGSADPGTCTEIPEETAGPYPGDGSNGPNVLTQSGIVRNDIRSSFGGPTGVAEGIPFTIKLTVQDADTCAPMPGAAVYLWHCDRSGQYSMYSRGVENENYLRGVQVADDAGQVTFTSIFPACYDGRWPHTHFEVYPDVTSATSAGSVLRTSQMALPQDVCEAVYATDGYSASVDNLAQVSLQTDMVFGDGYQNQMATVTGDVQNGYTGALTVSV